MKANVVNAPEQNRPKAGGHASRQSVPNAAQMILAATAVLGIVYVGKLVLVTLLFSVLLGFILEPLVGFLEHRRIARPYGALLAMLLLLGLMYAASYFFFVRVENFA